MGDKPFIPRPRGERGGHKGSTLRDKRTASTSERVTAMSVPVPRAEVRAEGK